MITEKQKDYILDLYKEIDIEPEEDIDNLTIAKLTMIKANWYGQQNTLLIPVLTFILSLWIRSQTNFGILVVLYVNLILKQVSY